MLDGRIKIHFFSLSRIMGGAEVYLKSLLLYFNYSRYKICLICTRGYPLLNDSDFKALIERGDVAISFYGIEKESKDLRESMAVACKLTIKQQLWRGLIPSSVKLFVGTVKDIIVLKRYFKCSDINILHINDAGAEPAGVAARFAGVPFILSTLHVMPHQTSGNWVSRLIEFFSIRSSHYSIAVSEAVKKDWIKETKISSSRIKVIYNGIEMSCFDGMGDDVLLKKDLNISSTDQVIVVPGRLEQMKGHKYLIEALLRIRDYLTGVQVLVVGDGSLRQELQNKIKEVELGNVVKFLGYRSDIPKIMALADLVVLSSVAFEALPYVLVEAQASGKAVVASNFSGIPEIVEDGVTGILVPPGDSDALAEAILKLLRNSQLRQSMGEKGRERARKLFSIDRMITQTFQLYEDFL